jgi:hypothetical protein
MKRVLISFTLMSLATMASAQLYYEDATNKEMLRHSAYHSESRKEITLPKQLNGYNVYKADLHTHTVYSDGSVTPQLRVQEAWLDGLDVMAVTEHIEYRPFEKTYAKYMGTEVKEADLNYSYQLSESEAKKWGMVIIPGTEITRNGTTVGHFNALFTTDNNAIYDDDPLVAIRNAKAQGALVMHNHPGWTRKDIDYTKVEKKAYNEGLIDGVEVMNTNEFYPGIVDRCRERGLFIAACSDIHGTTHNDYGYSGYLRPMTLILAKDNSLESLKEALAAGRTIALGFNTVCGIEELLESFVKASVTANKVPDSNNIMLTNNTSVPFLVQQGDANPFYLDPFSTVRVSGKNCKDNVKLKVLNAFVSENEHLEVKISF